jgi:hypothetical protein
VGSTEALAHARSHREGLNAICPYFTMFPLDFPLGVLSRAPANVTVLDPFCGRGTTGFAARIMRLGSIGIDSHPLAAAVAEAKHLSTTPKAILRALDGILSDGENEPKVPQGDFWSLAYEGTTLAALVRVRNALLLDCRSAARKALRAIMLGALHGPRSRGIASHFSNQAPRTYAPKPNYAVRFWRRHRLRPPKVDIRRVVERRALRYYSATLPLPEGAVFLGDSRRTDLFEHRIGRGCVDWIVTSPPYYGLRTYRPDQWLRLWFLGGSENVDYSQEGQLAHGSPQGFAAELRKVWENCATVARSGARMVVRFGGISDRAADPPSIFKESIRDTGWSLQTCCEAGSAATGKRQADHFGVRSAARIEHDYWMVLA